MNPDVERFLLAEHKDTDLTFFDVYKIGASLLNRIGTTVTLGHTKPGHTLDYIAPTVDLWTGVVNDFTAWTSGRMHLAPGCDERQRTFIRESGWQRFQLAQAAEALGLGEPA